jgi:hypothetical protein
MSRILLTTGPGDWRKLLADPEKHWRVGYSACTLAHCWEDADGLPPEIDRVLVRTAEPLLAKLRAVLAVPEFKVPMPGGGHPSQNDLFVLAQSSAGVVTVMVEGKVDESFGPMLDEWYVDASQGKIDRLEFLSRMLGISAPLKKGIRYQFLHRAASAIITGEQYRAVAAVLLVHSFSPKHVGWKDYEAFAALFGVNAEVNVIQCLGSAMRMPLFAGWVMGNPAYLTRG